MPLKMIRNDITKVEADIIVNTANPKPIFATGTDRAIYQAAGIEKLLAERKKIGEIPRGGIAVTPAFHLNAKYIIHAVAPLWEGGNNGEFDLLRICYQKSLEKAIELQCESIAIPLLASGANRFPKVEALQIALEIINRFLLEYELDVILVVFDKKSFELSERVSQAVHAYIDQNYVDERQKEEYPHKDERAMKEMEIGSILKKESFLICGELTREKILQYKEESFHEYLLRTMREREMDPPDVYKAANLDRRMFSKLLKEKNTKPKKKTVIAIALALQLNIEQTVAVLEKAGYALTKNNEFDLIIRWCIENHHYNIVREVNPILFEFELPELGTSVRE